jgi:hypothetical protein
MALGNRAVFAGPMIRHRRTSLPHDIEVAAVGARLMPMRSDICHERRIGDAQRGDCEQPARISATPARWTIAEGSLTLRAPPFIRQFPQLGGNIPIGRALCQNISSKPPL